MERYERVDYVRLRMAADSLERADLCEQWRERVEMICHAEDLSNKCYGTDMYFDNGLGKKIAYFNVWGQAANSFFHSLPLAEFRYLLRLDWREELRTEAVDFDSLFQQTKARNKGKGSVQMFDSAFRSKAGGRDTGGTSIAIGAPGSQRRISVYQRGHEGAVWEFQMCGAALKKLVNTRLADVNVEHMTPNEAVREALKDAGHKQFIKNIGLSVAEVEEGQHTQNRIVDYTSPEEVLHQLDLLWEVLPPDAKEAFFEAHSTADPHTVARAVDDELFVNEEDWEEAPASAPEWPMFSEAEFDAIVESMPDEVAKPLYDALRPYYVEDDRLDRDLGD